MNEFRLLRMNRGGGVEGDDYDIGLMVIKPSPEWHNIVSTARQALNAAVARLPEHRYAILTLEIPGDEGKYGVINQNTMDGTGWGNFSNRTLYRQAEHAMMHWYGRIGSHTRVQVPDGHDFLSLIDDFTSRCDLGIIHQPGSPARHYVFLKDEEWESSHFSIDEFLGVVTGESVNMLSMPLLEGGE
jgi:hypothetical protein